MARPKTGYQLADGTKVPGTTTVTGRFKESGALIGWAYKRGLAGVPLYESRDDAADKGTNIHELVEMKIKGADDDAIQAQVRSDQALEGYMSFVKWYEGTKIKVVETETPLVSERYRFGGTPDGIGLDGNALCLLDWKSGGGPYVDQLCQLGAYRILWEENHPGQSLAGGFHLCKFGKDNGQFSHYYFRELDEAGQMFLLLREAFEMDKHLRERLK